MRHILAIFFLSLFALFAAAMIKSQSLQMYQLTYGENGESHYGMAPLSGRSPLGESEDDHVYVTPNMNLNYGGGVNVTPGGHITVGPGY